MDKIVAEYGVQFVPLGREVVRKVWGPELIASRTVTVKRSETEVCRVSLALIRKVKTPAPVGKD